MRNDRKLDGWMSNSKWTGVAIKEADAPGWRANSTAGRLKILLVAKDRVRMKIHAENVGMDCDVFMPTF